MAHFKALIIIIDTLDKDRKASGRNVVLLLLNKVPDIVKEIITSYLYKIIYIKF